MLKEKRLELISCLLDYFEKIVAWIGLTTVITYHEQIIKLVDLSIKNQKTGGYLLPIICGIVNMQVMVYSCSFSDEGGAEQCCVQLHSI